MHHRRAGKIQRLIGRRPHRRAAAFSVPGPAQITPIRRVAHTCTPAQASSTCTPCSTWPSWRLHAAGAIINRAALDVEAVRISQKQINDFVTGGTTPARRPSSRPRSRPTPGHGILAENRAASTAPRILEFVWGHRPAGRHHQLHPRFSGLRVSIALAVRGRRSSRWSFTTPAATTCSPPPGPRRLPERAGASA